MLQDQEKAHEFKNSETRGNEKQGADNHGRSEKGSEFLAGLMEGIFLPKTVSKDWRR